MFSSLRLTTTLFRRSFAKCGQQMNIHFRAKPFPQILATSDSSKSINYSQVRYKSFLGRKMEKLNKANSGSVQEVDKSEDEEEEAEDDLEGLIKTYTIVAKGIGRVDSVIKRGFGYTRDKTEELFYENKIRVNGEPLPKKSRLIRDGDVIDVYTGENVELANHIYVNRLEILETKPVNAGLSMKMRRTIKLVIPAYPVKTY